MSFISDLLFYGCLVTILIPVGILLHRFNCQPPEIKGLVFFLLLSFSCDLFAEITYRLHILYTNLGSNVYMIMTPMFASCFFYYCLRWPSWKRPLIAVNVLLMIFFLYNLFFLQKVGVNSYSATLGHLLILFLSISYYYKLIKELPAARIQDLPLFWIISSFFFTFSGKLVLLIVTNYMVTVLGDNLQALWILHNSLSLIGLLVLTWGAWIQTHPRNRLAQTR